MAVVTFPRKEKLTMMESDFFALARADPGRTITYSVVPVLVAVAQLLNGFYHHVSLVYPALFALSLVAFAVLATQYHIASHRVTQAWSTTERTAD
ncbi:hypothetical protein [Halostella sp. PRR32]|uniref:hypothetical protein n=1 Tax=Halostella sp. PRR32 TaxID=3098147 RepID=UPI00110D62AD|nr:hypothetical protein [Halostella sp. PRR32]